MLLALPLFTEIFSLYGAKGVDPTSGGWKGDIILLQMSNSS
jgi:hypothetical protein